MSKERNLSYSGAQTRTAFMKFGVHMKQLFLTCALFVYKSGERSPIKTENMRTKSAGKMVRRTEEGITLPCQNTLSLSYEAKA